MPTGDDRRTQRWSPRQMVAAALVVQLVLTLATVAFRRQRGPDDTDIYERYARLVLADRVPYCDFRVEYPPLAVPLFVVPALIGGGRDAYRIAFAVEMFLFNAATVWAVSAWVERREGPTRVPYRLVRYTLFYLCLSRLIVMRYDAAAMFAGFAAAAWWHSGRPGRGGIAAALGTLLKIYPAVVGVVAIARDLTGRDPGRWRGILGFAATFLLGALAWLAAGGAVGVAASLRYHVDRGFELGSVYSGLQMLAARAVGAEIEVIRHRAAWSSVTAWTARLLPLVFPIQAAAVLVVALTFVRRGQDDGMRYSAAAILAFVVTGKVFSPQYLIWLVPFMAVLEVPWSRKAGWIFAAGCAATLAAPALVASFPRTGIMVILAYNFKNALFLWLLALLTFARDGAPAAR